MFVMGAIHVLSKSMKEMLALPFSGNFHTDAIDATYFFFFLLSGMPSEFTLKYCGGAMIQWW